MSTKSGPILAFALALMANAASAETKEQYDWCYSPTATDEQTIQGCTAMIQSGRYTGTELGAAYNNRSTAYGDKGEWDLEARDIETALKIDPTNAEAFSNLGMVYFHQGKYARALSDFNQAIALKPSYANAFNNRGLTYAKMGDHAKAEQDYTAAMQNFDLAIGQSPGDALNFSKRCAARTFWPRQLDLALADCNKALELNPTFADAFTSRGFIFLQTGDDAQAIKDTDSALAIDPANPGALYLRGIAKVRSGNSAGGAADIASAKAIDSKIAKEYADFGLEPPPVQGRHPH